MAFNGQPAYVEALEGLSCYEQVYFCFNEKTMYYPQHPLGVWNYSPTYFLSNYPIIVSYVSQIVLLVQVHLAIIWQVYFPLQK